MLSIPSAPRWAAAIAFFMLAGFGGKAWADLIASWEIPVGFPNGTGNVPTGTSYLPPNQTSVGSNTGTFPLGGPAYPAGTPTYGVFAGNTAAILSLFHANGTTSYTSPAGNGSLYSFSANFWSSGDFWQAQVPTTGFTGISLSWDQARSATGPATFSLRMSTDGANFSDVIPSFAPLPTSVVGTGTWASGVYTPAYTFNTGTFTGAPAALAAANNRSMVWFRIVATATSPTAGTARIDNFQVIGVPEPASIGFAAAGVGIALVVWDRRSKRTRVNRGQTG